MTALIKPRPDSTGSRTQWAWRNKIRPLRETDWLTIYKHYIFTICYQDSELTIGGISYVR